jgi:hypothetical protein
MKIIWITFGLVVVFKMITGTIHHQSLRQYYVIESKLDSEKRSVLIILQKDQNNTLLKAEDNFLNRVLKFYRSEIDKAEEEEDGYD